MKKEKSTIHLQRVRKKLLEFGHDKSRVLLEPRELSYRVGRKMALHADRLWQKSLAGPNGPIDVIDMFSGCGGMSVGFKTVNALTPIYQQALAIDVDELANLSYEHNLGITPVKSDIALLARSGNTLKRLLEESRRRPDSPLVLIGCAPCQGFSSHRNSAGAEDQRNSLFVQFAKIAVRLLPDVVVVENVPELLTAKYWNHVEEARALLRRAGYHVNLSIHNMAEFGVAQERFRAVMLAMKSPFKPMSGFIPRGNFRTVRDAIASLPQIRAGERLESDPMHYTAAHSASTLNTIRAVPKNGGSRPAHVGPPCLIRAREKSGRGAYDDVYGRLHWDKPSITVTAYARNPASGRFVHPEQDRGLSVREAARLQGFPSNYWFAGSLDERFRQIGNAVPPIFSACLALHIAAELTSAPIAESSFDEGIVEPVGVSFSRLIPALKMGKQIEEVAGAMASK